ncbi:CHAT domain-containing protein [Streptomyces sp. 147326]|uniref:CHAT domain-containing protein n=1 Tax=Streptomyces sp. 147326 TaxID=3074379 RepID=UPI0038572BCA
MDDATHAADLRSTGRGLFGALLPSPLREVWQAEIDLRGSRVVLDFEPSALRPLPWELLCTPAPQERYLFDDETHPCVRAHIPFALETEPLTGPVRLLVVVGDPYDQTLNSDRELEAIYTGLSTVPCCWQVHVLRAPGKEKTRDVLTEFDPHVLHFIGHGRRVEAEPTLEIMAPGKPWYLSAGFIEGALDVPLRLAVLNACRTMDEDPQALVRELGDALFSRKTQAVVAMQGNIASAPAVRFSKEFYGQLAAGRALDEAMAHARNRLHWVEDSHPRDWAMPVLTVQADPAVALKWPEPLDHTRVTRTRGPEFEGPRWLVGRGDEHSRMMRRLNRTLETGTADLLAVTGGKEVGKSELTRSCLLTSSWCGVPVIYVNLANRGNLDLRKLLGHIKDAVPTWLGADVKSDVELFGNMLQSREDLFRSLREGNPTGVTPDEALPPLDDRPHDVLAYENGLLIDFKAFLRMVTRDPLVAGKPLLLVLDHVLQAERHGHVVERLLKPAAEGDFDPVRIVAVDSGLDAELGLQLVDLVMKVRPFDRTEAELLVREYCARRRDVYRGQQPDDESWAIFTRSMRDEALRREQNGDESFSPKELMLWEQMAYTLLQVTS